MLEHASKLGCPQISDASELDQGRTIPKLIVDYSPPHIGQFDRWSWTAGACNGAFFFLLIHKKSVGQGRCELLQKENVVWNKD